MANVKEIKILLSGIAQKILAPGIDVHTTCVKKFLDHIAVPVTLHALQEKFDEHPDNGTLLSIMDVLQQFTIDSEPVHKVGLSEFHKLSVPFLAVIKVEEKVAFTFIYEMNDAHVNYYNHKTGKEQVTDTAAFRKIYTGTILLVEKNVFSGERNYPAQLKKENRQLAARIFSNSLLPLCFIVSSAFSFARYGAASMSAIVFTLFSYLGMIFAGLLVLHDIDGKNSAVHQICSFSKKTNCSSVLDSGASKIWGISWSTIGFVYFSGGLLCLLLSSAYDLPVLFVVSWLNVFSLPYTIFSLYYQYRVVKQWCPVCLAVQGVLISQFVTAWAGGFHTQWPQAEILGSLAMLLLVSFSIPVIGLCLVVPAWKKMERARADKKDLYSLKHNADLFEALLSQQKKITMPAAGLGIFLGASKSQNKLIKVTNPFCTPCAKVHPEIENLIENLDVEVQIIFAISDSDNDDKAMPARHLLAIAEQGNEELTKHALSDWYLPEKKDYTLFSSRYPMSGSLQKQSEKIQAMRKWCVQNGITGTPTFFINGHPLPEMYSVADLKFFFNPVKSFT